MPLWRGSALGSVFTSISVPLPCRLLVIQVLPPLSTYSSPSRRATVRIACRSEPALGSVRPRLPRNSPLAILGNHWRFCSSVPARSMAEAMIKCELKMPQGAIQIDDTLTTICA